MAGKASKGPLWRQGEAQGSQRRGLGHGEAVASRMLRTAAGCQPVRCMTIGTTGQLYQCGPPEFQPTALQLGARMTNTYRTRVGKYLQI